MPLSLVLGLSLLAIVVGTLVFWTLPAIRAYFTYRGKRLITCPETHNAAAVNVAARTAAEAKLFGENSLRLDQCSRWPERQHCGQECLQQIEVDPASCLVWNIVSKWYEGKSCVFCHKKFDQMRHLDHPPALLSPNRESTEWNRFRPEQLPEVFRSYLPVCWNCHVAETFRRIHPELVVDRGRETHVSR